MTLLKALCLSLFFSAAGLFSLAGAGLAAESRFFSEMNDVPIMAGLYELPDETVVFDKAEGRIVESAAASETENANQIKGFYDATLPQLGWQRLGPESYARDGEKLTLRLESRGNVQVLRLTLTPAP